MLRITAEASGEGNAILRVEGQVVGPWVHELRRAAEAALARGARLTVDLAGVSFVDRSGVALLRRLRESPVVLVNCSLFVAEQLRAGSACGLAPR